jgi:ankyrin repeat protein
VAGDLNKVRALIEADPTLLESKDQWDHTPLHIACWREQVAVANFLIDKGANVNARNKYGVSVLCCAISDQKECFRSRKTPH